MKIFLIIITVLSIIIIASITLNTSIVNADELSDNIYQQMENIDTTELEEYFNNLNTIPNNIGFFDYLNKLLNGEFTLDFNSIFTYTANAFLNNFSHYLPVLISIIAIGLFSGLMKSLRSKYFLHDGDIVSLVCLLSIILLLISSINLLFENTENTIKNIAKLTEIMSPIILTLMVAGGGASSANIYKPTVVFLSNGIINIFLSIVLPLVSLMIVLTIITNFSDNIKITKFIDTITSIIKWIIGLIITIFGTYLTIQGITSASYDGISIKAAKYAISNSIPMVGGFLKDGFDLIIVSSVLIKNAIGVTTVIALLYTILSPVLSIAVFSLTLKFACAILEPVADNKIINFCTSTSRCLSYLTIYLLTVGLMLFITILLIMFTANSYF